MTDLAELQRAVDAFTAAHALDVPLDARLLDLAAEVGELAKERLKGTDYGRGDGLARGWADELGDALFVLACLANATNVDKETALRAALAKYERRIAARGRAGSAS